MDEQKWLDERRQISGALGLKGIGGEDVAPIAYVLAAIEQLQNKGTESLAAEVVELAAQIQSSAGLASRLLSAQKIQVEISDLIKAAKAAKES